MSSEDAEIVIIKFFFFNRNEGFQAPHSQLLTYSVVL